MRSDLAMLAALALCACRDPAAAPARSVPADGARVAAVAPADAAPVVVDAAPPADAAPPLAGSVRVAVVFTDELLKSEQHTLARIEKALAGVAPGGVAVAEASPEERAYAAAADGVAPAAWRTVETVIVLEILPPSGKKPDRITSGLGGILVSRAPHTRPIYRERVTGGMSLMLADDELTAWLVAGATP